MRPKESVVKDIIVRQSVGVDVSKETLVATMCKLDEDGIAHYSKAAEFKNDKTGINQLVKWSHKYAERETQESLQLRYMMESTGVYHEALANRLHLLECYVVVVMPNKARKFALYEDILTKNDKVDSRVLALLGCKEPYLREWEPPTPIYHQLRSMTRFNQDMQQELTVLRNHLEALEHSREPAKCVLNQYYAMIKALRRRIDKNRKDMEKLVISDGELVEKMVNIMTIPSIGFLTAITVVAETNGFALVQNRRQLTKYAGLDVRDNQSGPVEHKSRISKQGNSRIRAALYMAAIQAQNHSPRMKAVYDRIVERNPKVKMIAVTAMQRRLLLLIYAIWKSNEKYNENYVMKG